MTAHHLPPPEPPQEPVEREAPASVPAATVGRLGLYLRELQILKRAEVTTVKSQLLGQRLELSDSQIRRDLALFGHFGRRGVGYHVEDLIQSIRRILGGDRSWRVILIGMGNLGSALARYHGFVEQGFRLVAAFDNAPAKVGQSTAGIPVYDLEQLENIVSQHGVEMAILAVPSESAQSLVPRLAACGITGILNFAPVTLRLPPTVTGVEVDLAMELQRLAFAVASRSPQS